MDSCRTILEKIKNLPTLSPVLQRIRSVMGNADTSAADIVEVLKLDPAISGKVLRLANSAYIGIPRTVSSLQNAVVVLGQRRIYSLVLAATALSFFKGSGRRPFKIVDFWKHSVTVALVCESIARHLKRYDSMETGEFFCAGILHDIGKLALYVYDPSIIESAYRSCGQNACPFYLAEENSISHVNLGFHLAHRWNFPENLTNAIFYHHNPERTVAFKKIVAIVHVADIMAHMIGFQTVPGEIVPSISEFAVSQIELPPERLRAIANDAINDERKIESLIEFLS